MKNKILTIATIFLLFNCSSEGQKTKSKLDTNNPTIDTNIVCTASDKEFCQNILDTALQSNLHIKNLNEIVISVAKSLQGTQYVAGTLDKTATEKLIVDFSGLDCVTFLENVVVLSRLIKQKKNKFEDYSNELEKIRYRNGKLKKYPSRLHYFVDWIADNSKKEIIEDVTQSITGSKPYNKTFDFMSKNYMKYPKLTNNTFLIQLQNIERELSKQQFYHIEQTQISKAETEILDGDLIAITTTIKNLDIVHVGIAIHQNGHLHLLHASSTQQKVVISTKPLSKYILGNKIQSGIIVCRLLR